MLKNAGKYLGDPTVVSELVRGFVSRVVGLRATWHESGGAADPTEEIRQLVRDMGDVFLGRDARYVPQPFNARHRLGVMIRVALSSGDKDPGEAFFDLLARCALQSSIDLDAGKPAAQVQAELEVKVQAAIEFLLGRSQPAAWTDGEKATP
ncbi:hypothetical protein [Rivibacter subsaxonicus]|uniref:Uncharacterized protein n=1 Tax=Rivibacter subsaxonicus TaxID=457575 RepID=A0A4Q7VW37_9BURK|nr:hypothetical protein [Rivibacter subsaxonicus]RZU00891.1 hypothetical protein EV670_1604 [Rivibacter subsaxonicus]